MRTLVRPVHLKELSPERKGGVRCPECGAPTAVFDSRQSPHGWRRRRVCINEHRFTSYEVVSPVSPTILRGILNKIRRTQTELHDLRIAVTDMIGQEQAANTEAAE